MSLTTDTASSARSLTDACFDLAVARCRDLSRCGTFLDRTRYNDVETCTREVRNECVAARALRGVVAAVAHVEACTQNLAALDCAHRRDPAAQAHACGAIERGLLADGADCLRDGQCAGGLCDRGDRGCGVCVRAPQTGDRCASDSECGTLHCNPQIGECEPSTMPLLGTQPAGASCDDGSCDRADGLVCLGVESHWCVSPQLTPIGGSCADVASGLPVVCTAPGARCDRTTWKCAPRVAIGEPCDTHEDCAIGAACVGTNGRYRCAKESAACL